jgi:hypothetical protein
MRKKFFVKVVALVVCFAFLSLTIPGLYAAEKKPHKYDAKTYITKSWLVLSSVFEFFNNIFHPTKSLDPAKNSPNSNSSMVAQPTGDSPSPKIGDKD